MQKPSLVSPEQLVLCIPARPTNKTVLIVTTCNIIETRPKAARWAKPLDFTKHKLLGQSTVRRPGTESIVVTQMVNHSDVLGPPNWKDISSLASLNAKQLLTRYASVHTMQRPFPYWDPATDVELGKLLGSLAHHLASHQIDAQKL